MQPPAAGDKFAVCPELMRGLHVLLSSTTFPLDSREAVVGRGVRLGAAPADGDAIFVGTWGELARHINRLATATLAAAGRRATWTSIQINADTTAALHVDTGSTGLSYIVLAGCFSGGAFRCGDLLLRDTGFLLAFDGSTPHRSDDFSGQRYSVILHTAAPCAAGGAARDTLLDLEFPLPPQPGPPQAPSRPLATRPLRLLHLFAGPPSGQSIAHFVEQAVIAHRESDTAVPFDAVRASEIDIRRGADDDLRDSGLQLETLRAVAAGEWDIVIASPPSDTWSRARHGAGGAKPRPLRSKDHPWGLPGLPRSAQSACDVGSALVSFSLAVMGAVAAANRRGLPCTAILEHPEDLGVGPHGRPASVWQLDATRDLVYNQGFDTIVLHQCAFGAASRRPTRFVTNSAGFAGLGLNGWPSFSASGRYLGPLPLACGHAHLGRRLGGAPRRHSDPAEAGPFPPDLSKAIAAHLFEDLLSQSRRGLLAPSPSTAPAALGRRVSFNDPPEVTKEAVYIGRGAPARGLSPSRWANPFTVKRFGRLGAVTRFGDFLARSAPLREALPELRGRALLCHCRRGDLCHGDLLALAAAAQDITPEGIRQITTEVCCIRDGPTFPPARCPRFLHRPHADLSADLSGADEGQPGSDGRFAASHADDEQDSSSHGAADAPRCGIPGGAPGAHAAPPDDMDSGNPEPAALGAGPVGRGPPLRTTRRGLPRDLVDGGGLCSPGKWPLDRRRYPEGALPERIRQVFGESLAAFESLLHTDGRGSLRGFLFELAVGRYKANPFPPAIIDPLRENLKGILTGAGWPTEPQQGDMPQAIDVRLAEALGRAMSDPDAQIGGMAAQGVRTGALSALPRTPAIFERKTAWALRSEQGDPWGGERLRGNYASAADRPHILERQFEEEVSEGLMLKTTLGAARARWGRHLVVASLGAVEKCAERDEWRVIYDATHGVGVNARIRVLDQVRSPGWADICKLFEAMRADGLHAHFALGFDVSKAHRRVPVHPDEWGLLACRAAPPGAHDDPDETLYVNKVGTFGVASAGYWWSRLAALLVRLMFAVAGPTHPLYLLLYSDDGNLVGAGPRFERSILVALLLLVVLRVPLSWKKTRGGLQLEWVGYLLDVRGYQVGFAKRRLDWVQAFCARVADGAPVPVKDVQEGLGRLVFVAGPLPLARPFLGPVFAWVAAAPPGATLRPPTLVRAVLRWFAGALARHPWATARVGHSQGGELFRVDARAEGEDIAVIGGWATGLNPDPSTARWFSHRLTRAEAPWAFERGDPFRAIASLELLAVVYGVVLLVPEAPAEQLTSGSVVFSVATDNQGNEGLAAKWLTTKLPLGLVAMELAAQLGARNRALDLRWRRRDINQEADDLTNEEFHRFNPALRVAASSVADGLLCLPSLARELRGFRAAIAPPAAPAAAPARPPRPKRRRLREREPW